MSPLTDVIERIAHYAKQQNFANCVEATKDKARGLTLSPPIGDPPRLSIQQITEITQEYPFHLPTEVLELYQMGNGCLPIGFESYKDWNSLENYFMFPNLHMAQFLPLRDAMYFWEQDFKPGHIESVNPKIFPIISGFERRFWAITGSNLQCTTSPIFFYFCDFRQSITKLEWPSLTNLLLAWVEIKEQNLCDKDDDKILKIAKKYGGMTEDTCDGVELLWYLSFRL
jgi:hypothetical protein